MNRLGLFIVAVLVAGCATVNTTNGLRLLGNGRSHVEAAAAPAPCEAGDMHGCTTGSTFVLHGVNFEYDKVRLTPEAKNTLDGVVEALKARDEIKVEIDGHTDAKGSE